MRNALSRGTAHQSGADGFGSRERIREQIGSNLVDFSRQVGCSRDSLRIWVKQHETDTGKRDGVTTAERDRIKELERENRQLRQANEILKKGKTIFRH